SLSRPIRVLSLSLTAFRETSPLSPSLTCLSHPEPLPVTTPSFPLLPLPLLPLLLLPLPLPLPRHSVVRNETFQASVSSPCWRHTLTICRLTTPLRSLSVLYA